MQYSKIQRFTSFFVLFFFLFSTTINFPISDSSVYADDESYKNIVSVIVNEDMYDSLKGSLSTYANNISTQLENTKVVILPTPSNASSYEIASLNESLYFEGLKSIDNTLKNWKLVWTVIVWSLELPVAYENTDAQKTIIPYVDFEDKYFLYNHENWKFEKNDSNINGLGVEIWHWIISPNLWSEEKNIIAIQEYFSKNNDYYNSQGLFKNNNWVLNGDINSSIPEPYEPYVFYYDQIRETKALNLESYSAYQAYQENKEDIIYKRYNQELSDRIRDRIMWSQDDSLDNLQNILWDSIDLSAGVNWPEMLNVPDIQTRHVINKATKQFAEIFSQWSIWELRKNVHNAWRYNYPTNKVNVDFIPYLITILDWVNDEIIKEANDDLEEKIDDLIKNGLSRDIAIPTKFVNTIDYRDSIINEKAVTCDWDPVWTFNCTDSEDNSQDNAYGDHYTNMYFGTQWKNVNLPEDCTIYRGSRYNTWTIVRANRSYNVDNIQGDIDRLNNVPWDGVSGSDCLAGVESGVGLNWYYGRNTGLYLDKNKSAWWELVLKNWFDENGALIPLFDIKGSKSINTTGINEPSYLNCLDSNYYLTQINKFVDNGASTWWIETVYQTPLNWASPIDWTCETVNRKSWYNQTYDALYRAWKCRNMICVDGQKTINFNQIPSYMEHKAPTVSQLWKEIQAWVTPSLPIDRDRYIDFMANDDSYQKINYEYLFRNFSWKTFEDVQKELKIKLDIKSNKLNNIVNSTDGRFPVLEESTREVFNNSIWDIRTSISDELDFEDNISNKESDIVTLSGTGSVGWNSEENGILWKDNEKIIEQSEQLNLSTIDLESEKDLFIVLREELIIKKDALVVYMEEFDTTLTQWKYCKNSDCWTGWLSIIDKNSLDYELSILNTQLLDYQEYINKLEVLIYKLEVQKLEMDFISLKFKIQVENLSQLWSTLEYDKNGISPIYEELNQRIKELDESEKSYEITDKTEEIQERIDYLFWVIDKLDISEEESSVVNLSNNIKFENNDIINIVNSKINNNEILNEYSDNITKVNEVLLLEKELSQKKLQLANSIKNISNLCSSDSEGNVDKDKCKLVFERIEELKKSEHYIQREQEISSLKNSINNKNNYLTGSYILWTTSNVKNIISNIESEKADLEIFRKKFNIDSININNNIDSINNGLHSVNSKLISNISSVKSTSDNIEKINDELDDINSDFKIKAEEIKVVDDNITKTSNDIKSYLATTDIDGNPYLELYDFRNSLVYDRDNLKIKENELDWIVIDLKNKRDELSSEILKLKWERVVLLNTYNTYDTKKENRKIYSCTWDVCDKWITETSHAAIWLSIVDTEEIISEYETHLAEINVMIWSIDINNTEIDVLISDVLQEIDDVDTYIFELRIDDQEYKESLLVNSQSDFVSKNNLIVNKRDEVDTVIWIFRPFTELKDTNDDYIANYTLDSIDTKFVEVWYDSDDYFTALDIRTATKIIRYDSANNPVYGFSHYYITRGTLLSKLIQLDKAKIELDTRVSLSNTYLLELANKISEKNTEINNLNNLIVEISNDNSDDWVIKNSIQTNLDFIKLNTDLSWVSHVNFNIDKIDNLNNYYSLLDDFTTNINLFFTDKLVNELVVPVFIELDTISRTSYYLGNPITDFTTYKNSITTSSNKVISEIIVVHNQFDNIFNEILSILNWSNNIWDNFYEGLIGWLDSITSGILSSWNSIFRKWVNFNIVKNLSDINNNINEIKLHIFNSNNSINSVYKSSTDIWLKLIWIENYNNDEINEYSVNNIEPNIAKVDDIKAKEFYGWADENEKVWIIWEWGKWWNLDNDTQEFYGVIDEHIVDLRDTEIFEDFRTAETHPDSDINLYDFISSKEDKTLTIWQDTKTLTYLDSLTFAIYWNNLNSVSAKYKFIFENYLNDQFIGAEVKYNIPKNKKQYEIAYLWASWDAENMYVQMNPEAKADNPYKDIIQKNASLQSKLLGQNISGNNNADWEKKDEVWMFKCAPPEWVPIYEWIPAVVCWLDDMMPPTITVSDSTCGPTLDLLSNEDKEYLEQCNWDVDKNWVNDCIENKLDNGSIQSFSDTNRIYYNKPGTITAQLFDESDNVLTFDNNTNIQFNLVQIDIPNDSKKEFSGSNKQTVFNEWDDIFIAKKYINFSPNSLKVQWWVVETQFSSKGVDADYYFQASLVIHNNEWKEEIAKKWDIVKVEVRGDRLFSTAYNLIENSETWDIDAVVNNNSITVSDSSQLFLIDKNNSHIDDIKKQIFSKNNNPDKMVVSLDNISQGWNTLALVYPLSITLTNWINWKLVESISINSQDLKSFYSLPSVKKAGHYTLEIKDNNGFVTKKELDFVSDEAVKFEISTWASVLESDGAVSSNVLTILDKFDNPVVWKTNTLDIDIDWNSIVFEHNNETQSSSQVIEWYKIFRFKSLNDTWKNTVNFELKDFFWETILSDSIEVRVVENIFVKVIPNNSIKVWWGIYKIKVQIEDQNGSVYSDINSRAYLNINNIYSRTTKAYYEIKNWVAEIELQTTTLAWADVPVEIQIEWLRKIFNDSIKINHDIPAYLQLWMDQYWVEAKEWSTANVEVYLKDQYWNITFNHAWKLDLEILPEYEKYLTSNWPANISKGIANLKVSGTDLPWMAYFKVSYNWFDAVWKINSYYYWNDSVIKETSYNSLYTTLLWAPYGDITKENYLAGSLLFNDNKSLAVTALLNSPYKHNDVVMVDNKWSIKSIAAKDDLSTDINFNVTVENNKINVWIKNSALWNFIWKIQPVLWGDTELKLCSWNNGNLSSCDISEENTSIILQWDTNDYNAYSDNESLYIQDSYGRKIFSIDTQGNIQRKWKIYFELELSNSDLLQFWLYISWIKIWTLWYNFVNADVKSTRNTEIFNTKTTTATNTILILLAGWNYASRDVYDNWWTNKVIYFNSPFDVENQLNDFSKWNMSAYENFAEKPGLWWTEWNKSLLQFSAGENVWESVKMYQSFSVVNLWDPVVSLKKIQRTLPKKTDTLRKFDPTLWKIISNKSTVNSYAIFDYNNDGKDDLFYVHWNKYIELLENVESEKDFTSKGNLAQIYDLWFAEAVKGWDFTWDGFDDIVFVNNQWALFLLNNVNKNFTRYDISSYIPDKVIRLEVADMDKDGKTDIITLDEQGFVKVLYGLWDSQNPKFEVEVAWNAWRPTLNWWARTDNWAIYYSGLVTLWQAWDNSELLKESEAFQEAINQNVENLADYQWNWVNTTALDQLLFIKIPYTPGWVSENNTNNNDSWTAQDLIDSIQIPTSPETENWIKGSITGFTNLLNDNSNVYSFPNVNPETSESDFIKSEYAEVLDVKINKFYKWSLTWWSQVDFTLEITNNTANKLDSVAYVEDIAVLFTLEEATVETSNSDAIVRYDVPWYDFLVDNFSLAPGEKFTLTAKLSTAPIKYGHIQVWNFQEPKSSEDGFFDIIYWASHQNCWETKILFESCATDKNNNNKNDCSETNVVKPWFNQTTNSPKCNEENIGLPSEVSKNAQDNDGNWIPDYIDDLTSASPAEQSTYAQSITSQISTDSDGDWVPDLEDLTDSSNDFLSNLEDVEENIDHILTWVDNLIQWFSCWFGWGGCIATPLNWAPLAPGWDPTLFGTPIWDWLNIDEWIPVFSSLTWMWYWPYCLPAVWPISPLSEWCSDIWAWGYLWVDSPSNFFRLFATPTLTWWFGVAACFGWPARVAWYSNMPGLHPLLPGGNCIVTAMPLSSCSNDGSDWDPWSVWFSQVGWWGWWSSWNSNGWWVGFWIFNANCTWDKNQKTDVNLDLVQEYLDYKSTWVKSDSFEDKFKESFTQISNPSAWNSSPNLNEPLVQLNGQSLDDELAVNIDFWEIKSWNFADVIQVQNRRISAFPDFLMWWVTRQIEEIVNKLTDFPTVFIILPDFSWVLDFWESEGKDMNDVISADKNFTGLVWSWNLDTVNSWIKEAYSFLANIPLISFQQESLSVEIPWVDSNEVNATIEKWWVTKDQWKNEISRAQDAWSFWATCSSDNPNMTQKECEDAHAASQKIMLQTDELIGSLEQNLEVLKTYKDFPKKLNKLVKKKEDYLEQILCNVESISEILWGWIGRNGERFKAWVELYILIKAILKSWQLLIDVFVDYEAECAECKNERGDLMTFIWKIISAVIPKIPVIQFPKWPDIIMDLHNIRAGLTISLPEFTFGTRPILLPSLPNLYLPDVPNVSINLPTIPVLPTIEIPDLPDLPVLPTVELPNLPPPPTLPKMFASLEGVLEILKAITKAMCILKTSPFVPEWRAGDQIAFLTERQWYLPTDFIDLSMPQFSYPFVDAIKVTTFVNLEFETDFVTELARQITMPLTTFSNDFTQILNLWVDDLDFSQLPSHIDINIWTDWAEGEISYSKQDLATWFAVYLSQWISDLVTYLDENKEITVSNNEFKILVSQALASDVFVAHPKYSSFRNVWDEVFEYNFNKEDKFIADLQKNNFDKFETVKDILHTEILKNKEVEKNLEKYIQPSYITKVDANISSDVKAYNTQLDKYNEKFIESARNLIKPGGDEMVPELAQRWEQLLDSVWGVFTSTSTSGNITASSGWANACQEQAVSPYRYNYKGIYTVEEVNNKDYSYLLFDYLDDLDWKEKINNLDTDNDGDQDIIYMMNGQIFVKENLETVSNNSSRDVETIKSKDNPFYNWDIFYSAVDNFREWLIDNNVINTNFSSSTNSAISNYRMSFTRLIDRTTQRKSIVDWFADSVNTTFDKENEIFSFSQNLAYIKNIWKFKDLVLTTKELINIKDDLENDNIVDISAGTKVYAWDQAFRLSYMIDGSTNQQVIVVNKYQNIELKSSIKVIWISWNAYIQGRYEKSFRSEEIRTYKWLPLSLWSHIEYVWSMDSIDPMTYIEINYYDWTEALLNFNFIEEYWLYDLWTNVDKLAISLNMDNDYLYAYIQSFSENIFSTLSNQIVLSPQKEADDIAPELHLSGIKIPVYQQKTIDLGTMIYEDWGLKWLQKIIVDMDLEVDSDWDWDTKNDADLWENSIIHTWLKLELVLWKFDYLVKKEIWITLVDENNNQSFTQVPFEIYSPTPEIDTINELWLVWLIDENLDDEPVSLYRYRWGVVSKLNNDEWTNKTWTNAWDYKFKVDEDNTGLTLEYGDTLVAEILENTWKIILKDFSSVIKVFPSDNLDNDSYYPKIEIFKNWNSIYYQYLQVSEWKTINIVENFDNVETQGMYMKFTNTQDYGYYQIPETVSYNPWALVIYRLSDINKEPLFIVYPDGKIETINNNYSLEYNYENEYIILNLIDKHYNIEISQLLFSIDGWYIMK